MRCVMPGLGRVIFRQHFGKYKDLPDKRKTRQQGREGAESQERV